MTRKLRLYLLAITLALGLAPRPAHAQTTPTCPIPPAPGWTATEATTWSEICAGQPATLTSGQTLSGSFLQTILTDPKFKITSTTAPIVISGAHVPDPVIIENATLQNKLYLQNTHFDASLEIYDSTSSQGLVLDGDQLAGPLIIHRSTFSYLTVQNTTGPAVSIVNTAFADNVQFSSVQFPTGLTIASSKIGGDLGMVPLSPGTGNIFGPVTLLGLTLDGAASINNSDFTGEFDGALSKFNGGLGIWNSNFDDVVLFRDTSFAKSVTLSSSSFATDIRFETSNFKSELSLDQVHLCLTTKPCELFLAAANFSGQVIITNSIINGDINADNAILTASIELSHDSDTKHPAALTMIGAAVAGNVTIGSTTLAQLELANAHITGDLQFLQLRSPPSQGPPWQGPAWTPDARLGLSGANIGVLSNATWEWPRQMNLTGMRFGLIGLEDPDLDQNCDWATWLNGTVYSPEPYQQLSKYLADAGNADAATCVLITSKTRSLANMPRLKWLGWWSYGQVAGFGYAPERAFIYAAFFIILGVVVLRAGGQGPKNHMQVGLFYSFSEFIPLVSLDKKFDDIELTGLTRWYFYLHKIIGYVIALFIAAALTGLTTKS